MCVEKEEAQKKIDRLITAIDRLTYALERNVGDPSKFDTAQFARVIGAVVEEKYGIHPRLLPEPSNV